MSAGKLVTAARLVREPPAVLGNDRLSEAEPDDALQAEEPADDQCPLRPGTGQRRIELVAAWLDSEPRRAVPAEAPGELGSPAHTGQSAVVGKAGLPAADEMTAGCRTGQRAATNRAASYWAAGYRAGSYRAASYRAASQRAASYRAA